MGAKKEWKKAGVNIGHAFRDFGKAMATTAKVTFGNEEKYDEEGNNKIKGSWKKMGKEFGEAGKSVGKAAKETVNVADEKTSEENKESEVKKDDAIDVEFEEKK